MSNCHKQKVSVDTLILQKYFLLKITDFLLQEKLQNPADYIPVLLQISCLSKKKRPTDCRFNLTKKKCLSIDTVAVINRCVCLFHNVNLR